MAKRTGPAGVLVTPGASADRDSRTLVALDDGLDLPVARITIRGRAVPKVHAQLRDDMATFAAQIASTPDQLVIGGRSFGGRMCSLLAVDEAVAGLVLMSYPLHPPGKPDTLRVEHFPAITVPTLFVSGTKDPFGTPAELEAHAAAIPGPVEFVWIDGQGHSPQDDAPVVAAVGEWLSRLR